MVVVSIVSSQIRKEFLRNWGLSSLLYLIGLTVTRGTVSELQIMLASAVLGFAQIFGGTLIQCSNQFHYFTALCGYPYVQVVFEHFFGNLQDMEWNPASCVTATRTKAWWGTAGWNPPQQ